MLDYRDGAAAAFEALYARHKTPLFRFVLRSVRERGQAEELHQDIWMRVIEARARYQPQARFTTWLYTIAHNRLVDHWRRSGLRIVSLDDDEARALRQTIELTPPTLVCAEEGKNGLWGPAPSPSMLLGGAAGFLMR